MRASNIFLLFISLSIGCGVTINTFHQASEEEQIEFIGKLDKQSDYQIALHRTKSLSVKKQIIDKLLQQHLIQEISSNNYKNWSGDINDNRKALNYAISRIYSQKELQKLYSSVSEEFAKKIILEFIRYDIILEELWLSESDKELQKAIINKMSKEELLLKIYPLVDEKATKSIVLQKIKNQSTLEKLWFTESNSDLKNAILSKITNEDALTKICLQAEESNSDLMNVCERMINNTINNFWSLSSLSYSDNSLISCPSIKKLLKIGLEKNYNSERKIRNTYSKLEAYEWILHLEKKYNNCYSEQMNPEFKIVALSLLERIYVSDWRIKDESERKKIKEIRKEILLNIKGDENIKNLIKGGSNIIYSNLKGLLRNMSQDGLYNFLKELNFEDNCGFSTCTSIIQALNEVNQRRLLYDEEFRIKYWGSLIKYGSPKLLLEMLELNNMEFLKENLGNYSGDGDLQKDGMFGFSYSARTINRLIYNLSDFDLINLINKVKRLKVNCGDEFPTPVNHPCKDILIANCIGQLRSLKSLKKLNASSLGRFSKYVYKTKNRIFNTSEIEDNIRIFVERDIDSADYGRIPHLKEESLYNELVYFSFFNEDYENIGSISFGESLPHKYKTGDRRPFLYAKVRLNAVYQELNNLRN